MSSEIDRAFYITFSSTVQIGSFYGDVHLSPGCLVDVFVVDLLTQVARGDSRYLCIANTYADGVFNCNHTLKGNKIVFFPLTTEQPGNLIFRETRAWSRKDLAQETTTTLNLFGTTTITATNGDTSGKGLLGASKPELTRDHFVTINANNALLINLGGSPFIEGIWIRLGDNSATTNDYMNVSYENS